MCTTQYCRRGALSTARSSVVVTSSRVIRLHPSSGAPCTDESVSLPAPSCHPSATRARTVNGLILVSLLRHLALIYNPIFSLLTLQSTIVNGRFRVMTRVMR